MKTIYLDNAATSFPKPEAMLAAMTAYQQAVGANPGRSGHGLSIDAGPNYLRNTRKPWRVFSISKIRCALF